MGPISQSQLPSKDKTVASPLQLAPHGHEAHITRAADHLHVEPKAEVLLRPVTASNHHSMHFLTCCAMQTCLHGAAIHAMLPGQAF